MELLVFVFIGFSAISLTNGKCKIIESGLKSEDQAIVLDQHNSFRLSLAQGKVSGQPKACNMKKMRYDSKLAKAAQDITDTCIFKHVPVEDPRWYWVGQNLYMLSGFEDTKGLDWKAPVTLWFDEHKVYNYPNNTYEAGHYTQVVWADSDHVGCGYTMYETGGEYKYKKLVACNYGPGGNYPNQAPYETVVNGKCGCKNLC